MSTASASPTSPTSSSPVALVTGASRGIGLWLVTHLAAQGYKVFATVRKQADVAAAEKLGQNVTALVVELADAASVETLASKLKGQPIDLLINNAGVNGNDRSAGNLSWGEFRRVFTTNTFAPAMLAQALLPNLRLGKARKIVNVTSELGSIANATAGFSYAYNSSKSALNMITARLAKDLVSEGFTVLSICPGWNKTDMGGDQAPLDPKESTKTLLATTHRLGSADSGKYIRIDGTPIPF
jgi:NAD(P)-dependent dehydrogenase (short-subunit alcohol dehydrogenase family)